MCKFPMASAHSSRTHAETALPLVPRLSDIQQHSQSLLAIEAFCASARVPRHVRGSQATGVGLPDA